MQWHGMTIKYFTAVWKVLCYHVVCDYLIFKHGPVAWVRIDSMSYSGNESLKHFWGIWDYEIESSIT